MTLASFPSIHRERVWGKRVLHTFRALLSILFFLLSLTANPAFGEPSRKRLVEIFCEEFLSRSAEEDPLGVVPQEWEKFVGRLEHRAQLQREDTIPTEMQTCLLRFSEEFEIAEFISGGRDNVENQLQALKSQLVNVPLVQSDISRRVSALGLGDFEISNDPFNDSISHLEEWLFERRKNYDSLWQSFLQRLHEKLVRSAQIGFSPESQP